jgi:membrane protein required for colicin V production
MNGQWFDSLLIAVVVFSVLAGAFRGFVREFCALITFALGLWAIVVYGDVTAGFLKKWLAAPSARWVASSALVLLVSFAFGELLGAALAHFLRRKSLRLLDHGLGVAIGAARGVMINVLLVLLAGLTPVSRLAGFREARLIPPLVDAAKEVISRMPPSLQGHFRYDGP